MDARVAFILDWKSGRHKVSDLCAQYGVSRKTGYKLINRFMEEGPDGLWDRSHAPGTSPNKKLRWVLERRQPNRVIAPAMTRWPSL
jgi:transposase